MKNAKLEYLNHKYRNFQDAVKKTFATPILVSCDDRSLLYFNRNLLTPAEFLNALELRLKHTKVSFEHNETVVDFPLQPNGLSFLDLQEYDRFDQKSCKLDLLRYIAEGKPSQKILDLLEELTVNEMDDYIRFILENKEGLKWFDICQERLVNYFLKNLRELGFSLASRPPVICVFLTYDETSLETAVQKQANELISKHKQLFNEELWENNRLSVVIFVMFDIDKFDNAIDDTKLNQKLDSLTSVVKSFQVFKLPINNPQKSDDKELFDNSVDFGKHVYLKQKIQSYFVSEGEKVGANSVNDEDRAKHVNKYDIVIFKDNLEKALNDNTLSIYKRTLQFFYINIATLKKNKKKSFWSFLGGNRSEKNMKDEETDQKLMVFQFNLAEIFFFTGNFSSAAAEFKSLVNTYNKMDISFFTICLEYYIYSLVFCTKMGSVYSKVDGIVQKLMEYFLDPETLDILRCNRLSCLVNLILKLGKYYEDKKVGVLERNYIDFELNFNRMDKDKDFAFLKPLFKEEYCYKYLVSKKAEMRNFLFNVIITADYFGAKLKDNKHFQYTLYLYMFSFGYYQYNSEDWSYLIHFITQTISKNKRSLKSYEYAFRMYLKFVNTYFQNDVKKENEEYQVKIYLEKLLDKLNKTALVNVNELKIFDFEEDYRIINSDCFYNNKTSLGDSESKNVFKADEFIDIINKRIKSDDIANFNSFNEEVNLLYTETAQNTNEILRQYIKENFLGEEIFFEMTVDNSFNVG